MNAQSIRRPSAIRRLLLELLAPRRGALLLVALTVVAGAALELVPPLVMKAVVDDHLVPGEAEGLSVLAGYYLLSVIGVQGLRFVTNYLTALTAQGVLKELRVRLFGHLQQLPLSYYDTNPLGDIISRCTADVDTVDTLFSSGVAGLLTDLTRLLTVSIAMLVLSPELSLVTLVVLPPLVWVTNLFRHRIRAAERQNRLAVGAMNTHLQETLGGVEVIRAFARQSAFVVRFRRVLYKVLAANNAATKYSSLYPPTMQILMASVITLLLWGGTSAAMAAWEISLGTLIAFILLFRRFFDPITAVGEEWQTVQSALSGLERIGQVLDLSIDQPRAAAGATHTPSGGIEVCQVTFGYLPDQPVLRQVSFTVLPGEHVVLVGRTGAGKSSVLHLLGGLYAPWQGTVYVAGLNPRHLAESDRSKAIGVVPQTVQLFSGTVLDNLTLGDAAVSRDQAVAAAHLAGAHAFIQALPQGYDTLIHSGGGSGVQLSAGQRQYLSLARALVWNPDVLLFDEATSAIDSAGEAAFRQALRSAGLHHQRAILTVAHRLATAREADRVIVLEQGQIVEMGAPDALVRQGGRFAALLELEAAGWDWRRDLPSAHSL